MPASLLAPDLRRMVAAIERRLGILERRLRPGAVNDDTHETLFSYAGALVASTSPPVRLRHGGTLTVLVVTLGTAGSTDSVLTVQKNGATVATVTVPSSSTTHTGQVGAYFSADTDKLILTITTAGTDAANMTAEARFT